MDDLDTREWLLTNELGNFASGTVSDARTHTYHGWLIAALEPPSQRTLFDAADGLISWNAPDVALTWML